MILVPFLNNLVYTHIFRNLPVFDFPCHIISHKDEFALLFVKTSRMIISGLKIMTIDSYDWDELYAKANEFVSQYIPVATVNTNRKSFFNNRPRVNISLTAKGNTKYIKLIDEMQCIRKLKGANSKTGRIINAEIIFTADGSLEV